MFDLTTLTDAIVAGKRADAERLTSEALEAGADLREILGACVRGMDIVGDRFQRQEAFVPEMLIAARAMKQAMAVLEPRLVEAGIRPEGTAVIGTVEGDLHDIGKNLVSMMWKGANIDVVDLGTNVPAAKFIEAARERNAEIIGLSALLTTTMPSMKATIAEIRGAGIQAKILVGGAPITKEFAEEIGADGFAPDAAGAVEAARKVIAARA